MKETEKRMKAKTSIFGRIVKCYNLPLDGIEDLNKKYEEVKKDLNSYGKRLAGRLDSELDFTQIIQSTTLFSSIVNCMQDYIETLEKVNLFKGNKNLDILSC